MPIYNKEELTTELADIFTDICPIASIKPLIYTSTKLLSDQWMVSLDITDKESISLQFPRIVNIRNHKVSLHWRNAPTLCHFCDKEGHFRKNCPDLAEAQKGRTLLNELKEVQKETSSPGASTSQPKLPILTNAAVAVPLQVEMDELNNPFVEKEPSNQSFSKPEITTDEESAGYGSEVIPATEDSSSEMDTNTTHPRDFENTPTPADSILGKRPQEFSTGSTEQLYNDSTTLNRKHKKKNKKGNLSSLSANNQPKRPKNPSF
jgi:hypothetical protein